MTGDVQGGLENGKPKQPLAARLAIRNLVRGYRLGLPTGQAVARAMGIPPLAGQELVAMLPDGQGALLEELELVDRTPLWFYVLAEAGAATLPGPKGQTAGPDGHHLGPVGSRIVAETLYNLIRFSADSIIEQPGQRTWPRATLADILKLAGVA